MNNKHIVKMPKYIILAFIVFVRRAIFLIIKSLHSRKVQRNNCNNSVESLTRTHVACWFPIMAQRDLRLTKIRKISKFHTTDLPAVLRITTGILHNPELSNEDFRSYRGLVINVNVSIYENVEQGIFDWNKCVRRKRNLHIDKRLVLIKDKILPSTTSNNILLRLFKRYRRSLFAAVRTDNYKFTLVDYLPCGLAEFAVEGSKQLDEKTMGYIFYQMMPLFHSHHYHTTPIPVNKPILLNKHIDLTEMNNPVLAYYLHGFSEYLENSVDGLYEDYKLIDSSMKKRPLFERLTRSKRNERRFYDDCHNLLGVHVYLCSLLNTPQNSHWKLNSMPPKKNPEIQRVEEAMVIENAKNGTAALITKIRYHHDRRDYRLATFLGITGLIVGICSVILALLSNEVRSEISSGCNNLWSYLSSFWNALLQIAIDCGDKSAKP